MRLPLAALALLLILPPPGVAASFDCTLPTLAADERVICDTRDLNDADVRMVTTLDLLTGLFAMGTRGAIMDDQVAWLKRRMACGADAGCIRDTYRERQEQLEAIYNSIDRPL